MRFTSSTAARAAASALRASAWIWISFSAAIARKVKRCSVKGTRSERVAHADQSVIRAQRLERFVAPAAEMQRARVVHVARGSLDGEARLVAVDEAQRGREPAEGR